MRCFRAACSCGVPLAFGNPGRSAAGICLSFTSSLQHSNAAWGADCLCSFTAYAMELIHAKFHLNIAKHSMRWQASVTEWLQHTISGMTKGNSLTRRRARCGRQGSWGPTATGSKYYLQPTVSDRLQAVHQDTLTACASQPPNHNPFRNSLARSLF